MLNIVCVLRSGGKVGYDAQWVTKLHNGIKRNVTGNYRFVCFSDCDVDCERIPLDKGDNGFWSKLQLFKHNFNGPVLYIDLDTVICSSIDNIINNCIGQKFVMWYELDKDISSSAMMYWDGDYRFIWDIYTSKPSTYWKELYASPPLFGDQAVISENVEHALFTDICPPKWFHIAHKSDTMDKLKQVKLLMFRKVSQKPSTMLFHPLVEKFWI